MSAIASPEKIPAGRRFQPEPRFVTIRDGQFVLDGEPWYPYGVNYWPHHAREMTSDEESWLRPEHYDPAVVEADLRLMARLGYNCIAVRATPRRDARPALRDFLHRCQRHGLKVALHLDVDPFLGPMLHHPEKAFREVVRSLRLHRNDTIFAYDVAWDPRLTTWQGSRMHLDGIWSRWLAKTYGTLAAARAALGTELATSRPGPHAAGLLHHDFPTRAVAGGRYRVRVVVRNMSSDTAWRTDGSIRLGVRCPGVKVHLPLTAQTPPGANAAFELDFRVPDRPGRYECNASLTSRHARRIGPTLDHEIEVVATGSPVQKTIHLPEPVVAPADEELIDAVPSDVVFAYRRAIDSEIATRYGRVIRALRRADPHHLITARLTTDNPRSAGKMNPYPVPVVAIAHHLDFVALRNHACNRFLRYQTMAAHMTAIEAYCRWVSGGKPLYWIEAGYQGLQPTSAGQYQADQAAYFANFIDAMVSQTAANGVAFWWWPGGPRRDRRARDWGITNPDRTPRPAALVTADKAARATAPRSLPTTALTRTFDPFADSRAHYGLHRQIRPHGLAAVARGRRLQLRSRGDGRTSADPDLRCGGFSKYLWADLIRVEIRIGDRDEWIEVSDGRAYAVPAATPLTVRAEVVNLGEATWLAAGSGVDGAVAFAGDERRGLGFRIPLPDPVPRTGRAVIAPHPLTRGITTDVDVRFGIVAEGRGWASGGILIHLLAADA